MTYLSVQEVCPRCDRTVVLRDGRYPDHTINGGKYGNRCTLSSQRQVVRGYTDDDDESRAKLIGDLAQQVQDYDPHTVYEYLTALPAHELQRLLMFSLAAFPLDRSLYAAFHWVRKLPIAGAA